MNLAFFEVHPKFTIFKFFSAKNIAKAAQIIFIAILLINLLYMFIKVHKFTLTNKIYCTGVLGVLGVLTFA